MSFDRVAPHYRWMERLLAGEKLQQCRTAFLRECERAQTVLLVGEGHGRALEVFLRAMPGARFTYVDQSGGMLRQTRERLKRSGLPESSVQFIQNDIMEFRPEKRYDLLVTNFFLDCFPAATLAKLIPRLAKMLEADALWSLSDFQVPSSFFGGIRARAILFLAYRFFRAATGIPAGKLVPPQPFIRACGLEYLGRKNFDGNLLYAELWRTTPRAAS